MRRIIFLDIDGVLATGTASSGMPPIRPGALGTRAPWADFSRTRAHWPFRRRRW